MKIEKIGPIQLRRLREDVDINSLYLIDYENRYGVDPKEAYDFFMGYLDYLEELMREDFPVYKDKMFWNAFPHYDTKKNLWDWWCCWVG